MSLERPFIKTCNCLRVSYKVDLEQNELFISFKPFNWCISVSPELIEYQKSIAKVSLRLIKEA